MNELLDRFEEEAAMGKAAPIEDWLLQVDPDQHAECFGHLLAIEIFYRDKREEVVKPSDYLARFPDYKHEIDQAFDEFRKPQESIDETMENRVTGPKVPVAPAKQIGPYKLLQQIGEGGMGTVWMAEQLKPVRRRVALKVIKPGMDSRQVIARFEAERQALAMMDHQNIAKVLDAGMTSDGRPFFAMELVKGIPFTKYCDRNKLTPEARLELFIPVCRAIQHAHQKGIIHRDIKPSNVLVTLYDGQPVPKVIDFGLAKALQQVVKLTDKTMFTQFGQVVGTLQYMSPEQAEMNALDVDTRTDIYSLGVMLYELLTGSTPLSAEALGKEAHLKILETIREKDPPRPSTRLSESGDAITGISEQRKIAPARLQQILRGELDWIIMKALEKDRTRRYETASNFADDVQRFLNNDAVDARPPSIGYKLKKFVSKNRGMVATIVAVITLLIVAVAGTSIGMYQARIATGNAIQAKNDADEERKKVEAERNRAIHAMELTTQQTQTLLTALESAMQNTGTMTADTDSDFLIAKNKELAESALMGIDAAARQLEFQAREGLAELSELVAMGDKLQKLAGPPLDEKGIVQARQTIKRLYQTVTEVADKPQSARFNPGSPNARSRIEAEFGLAHLAIDSPGPDDQKLARAMPHLNAVLELRKGSIDGNNVPTDAMLDYISDLDRVATYYIQHGDYELRKSWEGKSLWNPDQETGFVDREFAGELQMEALAVCRRLLARQLSESERRTIIERCHRVADEYRVLDSVAFEHFQLVSDVIVKIPELSRLETEEIETAFDSALNASRLLGGMNRAKVRQTYLGHAVKFHQELSERNSGWEQFVQLEREFSPGMIRDMEPEAVGFGKAAFDRQFAVLESQADADIINKQIVDLITRQRREDQYWREYKSVTDYLYLQRNSNIELLNCFFTDSNQDLVPIDAEESFLRDQIETFESATKSQPEKVIPKIALVELNLSLARRNWRVAIPRLGAVVRTLEELSDGHPDFYSFSHCARQANELLGIAQAKHGKITEAVVCFTKALRLAEKEDQDSVVRNFDKTPSAHLNLAGCLILAGKFAEADIQLQKAVQGSKSDKGSHFLARANAMAGISLCLNGQQNSAMEAMKDAFAELGQRLELTEDLKQEVRQIRRGGYFCDLIFEKFETRPLFELLGQGIQSNGQSDKWEREEALVGLCSDFVHGSMRTENQTLFRLYAQKTVDSEIWQLPHVTSHLLGRVGKFRGSAGGRELLGRYLGCRVALGLIHLEDGDPKTAIKHLQFAENALDNEYKHDTFANPFEEAKLGVARFDYPTIFGLRCFAEFCQHGDLEKSLSQLDRFHRAFEPGQDNEDMHRYASETVTFIGRLLKAERFREAQHVVDHFATRSSDDLTSGVEFLELLADISGEFKPNAMNLEGKQRVFWSAVESRFLQQLEKTVVRTKSPDLFFAGGKFYSAGEFSLINENELDAATSMMEELVQKQKTFLLENSLSRYSFFDSQLALAALYARQKQFDDAESILADFLTAIDEHVHVLKENYDQFETVQKNVYEAWGKTVPLESTRKKMELSLLAAIETCEHEPGHASYMYSSVVTGRYERGLVELYKRWNKPAEARKWTRPDEDLNQECQLLLGDVYLNLGELYEFNADRAKTINQRVWDLVKQGPGSENLNAIKQDLQQIRTLCELFADQQYLRTRMVAQFRLGKYQDAIDSVKKSIAVQEFQKPRRVIADEDSSTSEPGPIEMTILAMSYDRIGNVEKANAARESLNKLVERDGFEPSATEEAFIRELDEYFLSRQ